MSSNIEILKLNKEVMESKIEDILSLEKNWTGIGEKAWSKSQFLRDLKKKRDLSFLAMKDGEVVGYSIGSEKYPGCSYLHKIVVDKNYRRMGIGQKLLESLSNVSVNLDSIMAMEFKSLAENDAANNFYFKNGFDIVGKDINYDNNKEMYILFKALKPSQVKIKHSKPTLGDEEVEGICDIIKGGELTTNFYVNKFEKELGNYTGGEAILTNSGSNAIILALKSLGVGKGDEVIMPSYICVSVLQSVLHTGAKPIITDINHDDFNISQKSLEEKISEKTKAIIAAHMFGIPIKNFENLKKYNIPIIEDCAQCFGIDYKGGKISSLGDISVLSFYATKLLTTGRGGALITKNKEYAKKAKRLMITDKSNEFILGHSFHMDEIHAYIGIKQLEKLPEFIKKRKDIASFYGESIKDTTHPEMFSRRFEKDNAFYRYVLLVDNPEMTIKKLNLFKVDADLPVYKPLHQLLGIYEKFNNTEIAQQHAISLPIYPTLTKKEAEFISRAYSASLG